MDDWAKNPCSVPVKDRPLPRRFLAVGWITNSTRADVPTHPTHPARTAVFVQGAGRFTPFQCNRRQDRLSIQEKGPILR
jgi:hypothetical protein